MGKHSQNEVIILNIDTRDWCVIIGPVKLGLQVEACTIMNNNIG